MYMENRLIRTFHVLTGLKKTLIQKVEMFWVISICSLILHENNYILTYKALNCIPSAI